MTEPGWLERSGGWKGRRPNSGGTAKAPHARLFIPVAFDKSRNATRGGPLR
jgi:hypothetical protein